MEKLYRSINHEQAYREGGHPTTLILLSAVLSKPPEMYQSLGS